MGQSIGTLLPLRWRLWLGQRLFGRPLGPTTTRVSWHRLIKGPCDPPEVEAMFYVASHTNVPIPKIHAVHTQKNGSIYIEMAFIKGQDLDSAWKTLSTEQRKTIIADLKQHISVIRGLQPPTQGVVSSALQNPAYDCRIGAQFYGPMSQDDFHSLVRGGLIMEDVAPFLGEAVHKVHNSHYETHFTHADLAPRNIIVRDGRIAAILDWAFAGWYPAYWEFTKAHYNYFSGEDWEDYLRVAIPVYETELSAERVLWRRLPDPGTACSYQRDGVRSRRPGSSPSEAWLKSRAGHNLTDLWSLRQL